MSQDPNTIDPQDDLQHPETEETPSQPTANSVSREDYEKLQAQLAHMGETVNYLRGQAEALGRQPPPPATPAEPAISDDELAEMLESGDGRQILKAQRYLQAQETKRLEAVNEQRYQNIVAMGTAITQRQIKADYPLYHTDPAIKRDVDQLFASVAPEARANPEAWDFIYRQVTASPQHYDRILNQKVEEEIRRRTAGDVSVTDPAQQPSGRMVKKPGGTPTVEELFGSDVARTFQNLGRNPDDLARDLGYASWDDYVKQTEEVDTTWLS